jgi:uncharacterized membrane protein
MGVLETIMPGLTGMPNSHPLFVHAPVILWPLAAIAWWAGVVRAKDELLTAGRWLAHLALASAAVTVITGLRAEASLGHESTHHDLVHVHKYFMLATTALGALTSVLLHLLRKSTERRARAVAGVLLIATVAVMILGADRGALLVYHHGMGTRVPPEATPKASNEDDSWPAHGPVETTEPAGHEDKPVGPSGGGHEDVPVDPKGGGHDGGHAH